MTTRDVAYALSAGVRPKYASVAES